MDLTQLQIPENKINQFRRAGIEQVEDLMYYFPRKYINRSTITGLLLEGESVFLFECDSVTMRNNKAMLIEAIGHVAGVNIPVHILWFNQAYLYKTISETKGKPVLVAGTVKYMPAEPIYKKQERFEIASPAVYDDAGSAGLKIHPVYKKIKGMADEYLVKAIHNAGVLLGPPEETLPEDIIQKYDLLSHDAMVACLHEPPDKETLDYAIRRKRWDDLVYFALRIEMNNRSVSNGSIYNLPSLVDMNKVRNNLPFQLTNAQNEVLNNAIDYIRTGKRLNALVQGDVGCGKTIIAQLLMIAFASNGYQAAMMAPTQLLAKQHYEDLRKLCLPLNIPVVFVGAEPQKTKRMALEANLANGNARLIVGTQALLSEHYQFKNLALVIEDEEHKYGVLQRKSLTEKAQGGTHTITMSATPIPRTLAQTIYGDNLQLYSITEKPAGRKPIMTGIATDETKAIAFLKRNCGQLGYQAYVVCPMIYKNEKVKDIATAEDTFKKYKNALEPDGITIALVTGKTPKAEAQQLLTAFEAGAISVLVSTTIIEVGINVPNANCMIIHNAERFGLAQLHQLRGRVGRGTSNAYCSLISPDPNNPRLQAMVASNDGFMIAQMDLQQRGAGDFLGVQQSGTERYLALALQYPKEYKDAQAAARDILDRGDSCPILVQALEDRNNQKGGDIL